MAKKPKKLSKSDRTAARTKQPGTQPQKPSERFVIRSADGKRVLAKSSMNYKGVAGGEPTASSSELRERAKSYDKTGASDSARAARKRADNVDGHKNMTEKTKREIAEEKRKAKLRRMFPKSNHK